MEPCGTPHLTDNLADIGVKISKLCSICEIALNPFIGNSTYFISIKFAHNSIFGLAVLNALLKSLNVRHVS